MRRSAALLAIVAAAAALAFLSACASGPVHPSTGRKIAIRPVSNKTQEPSLEDALGNALRDEFLRDGRYQVVPENESDDVLLVTLTRYILLPIAYDISLSPISYKLRIRADISMLERATNKELWTEKDLEGSLTYPNPILAGGQTEAQAQATIWTVLAPMIVERVVADFDVPPSTMTATQTPSAPAVPAPR